jgi:hypothetical protein
MHYLHCSRLNGTKTIFDDEIGRPGRAADNRGEVNIIQQSRAVGYPLKTGGFPHHL